MNAPIAAAVVVGQPPQTAWGSPNSGVLPSRRDRRPTRSKKLRWPRSVWERGGSPPLLFSASQSAAQAAHSKRCALIFALLLALCGGPLSAFAQSFSILWHTVDGGGGTRTGGVFTVSGTIGQPDAGGPMTGGQFSLTGGFWALPTFIQTPGAPTLYITNAAPGWATIWWTPATGANWILQERLSLSAGTWINSPSGWTNPAVVPATLPTQFYRLFRP